MRGCFFVGLWDKVTDLFREEPGDYIIRQVKSFAEQLEKQGDYATAAEKLINTLNNFPNNKSINNINTYCDIAYNLIQVKQYKKAIGYLQAMLKVDANNESALYYLAYTYKTIGDIETCRIYYKRLEKINQRLALSLNY
jgi:tetratricopeptide (TPR) repeat protein